MPWDGGAESHGAASPPGTCRFTASPVGRATGLASATQDALAQGGEVLAQRGEALSVGARLHAAIAVLCPVGWGVGSSAAGCPRTHWGALQVAASRGGARAWAWAWARGQRETLTFARKIPFLGT